MSYLYQMWWNVYRGRRCISIGKSMEVWLLASEASQSSCFFRIEIISHNLEFASKADLLQCLTNSRDGIKITFKYTYLRGLHFRSIILNFGNHDSLHDNLYLLICTNTLNTSRMNRILRDSSYLRELLLNEKIARQCLELAQGFCNLTVPLWQYMIFGNRQAFNCIL